MEPLIPDLKKREMIFFQGIWPVIWTVIEAKQPLWGLAEPGTSPWAAEMEAILRGAMGRAGYDICSSLTLRRRFCNLESHPC